VRGGVGVRCSYLCLGGPLLVGGLFGGGWVLQGWFAALLPLCGEV
jgi:hypothetical protein